jgi:endonuclease-3
MIKTSKKNIEKIKEILIERYKNAKTELNYKNEYELLISIILSAQCTDKRVNLITPKLFKQYPSTKELSKANIEDVKEIIKSCSFFNNKAKNIINMAKIVEENFNGKIPHNHKDLISLSGVGNKTANVFLIELDNENRMAVDTHVFRTSHRLGLSDAKNVELTEKDLIKAFQDNLHILHQALVLFGRYICTAKNPRCEKCFLKEYCKTTKTFKAN